MDERDKFYDKALADLWVAQQEIAAGARALSAGIERAENGIQEVKEGLSDARSGARKLEEAVTRQADTNKQLIELLRGMAERSAEAEIWRRKAEERFSSIEDWIDKQSDAS